MALVARAPIIVEHVPAVAVDSRVQLLFEARAALKSALQARDRAREAHLAAQRAVDQMRSLVGELEGNVRNPS